MPPVTFYAHLAAACAVTYSKRMKRDNRLAGSLPSFT
jgi:hypothetical protein